MYTKKSFIFSIFLFLTLSFFCGAESFRVAKTHLVSIPEDYSPQTIQIGIADGISIELPQDKTYISGLEINIKIPEIIASWRDSVAYSFYNQISPIPTTKRIDYKGNKVSINTVPTKLTHTIYLPLSNKFDIKESPYATILEQYKLADQDKLFLRFYLAMKGAPAALEKAELTVTFKPVLTDEGRLNLSFTHPENRNEEFSVYVDDNLIQEPKNPLILQTGEHHVSVTSEKYRNETRTFIIQQAQNTDLNIEFKGIEPTITILSPETTKITFDGEELITKEQFVVTQGEHLIKFTIGDYEIQKSITTENGRSYTVKLNIDAEIVEE